MPVYKFAAVVRTVSRDRRCTGEVEADSPEEGAEKVADRYAKHIGQAEVVHIGGFAYFPKPR